jgi:predicted outer membrane repeat protein
MRNKRSLSLGICLLFLSLVSTGSLEAATLDVCSSECTYSTIQSAINASSNGDTVQVSDGTYTENIDFSGKTITVTSVNGASSTTIDGNQSGSVVTFATSEGSGSVLDGFKLTNGSGTLQGTNYYLGGGIYCSSSTPSIVNCNITGNSASGNGYGGGIYCDASSPTVNNCNIDNNTVNNSGGGFFSENVGSPILNDCTIDGNSAGWGGGIGFYSNTGLTMNNCVISGNTATEDGGGFYSSGSTLLTKITNCIISGNTATYSAGGGIQNYASPYEITNSVIADNSADDSSYGEGGGIFDNTNGPSMTVTNSILWGNTAGVSGDQIFDDKGNR